jgi:copper(I)-binding protein
MAGDGPFQPSSQYVERFAHIKEPLLKSITSIRSTALTVGLMLLMHQVSSALASPGKQDALISKEPVVSGAYAHSTVSGQRVGAAYMKIASPHSTVLKRVESGAAEYVEVHQMKMRDGVMRMRQIEELKIPAGKEVELAPGGVHLMLIQLKRPLEPGEVVPLKMIFAGSSGKDVEIQVNAPVRSLGK